MKEGLLAPSEVTSLSLIPGLDAIMATPDCGLNVGPMVTLAHLAADPTIRDRYPALADAAGKSASPNSCRRDARRQPSAAIAHDRPAGGLIGVNADELRTAIGDAHSALDQQPEDVIGLLVVGAGKALPDLFLARVIVRHREGHQLVERDAVIGVEVEKLLRDSRQP